MTINTESRTAVTDQAKQVTERSIEAGKNLSQKLTSHMLPSVDLTPSVARYFAPLQKGVDLNRNLATQGVGLFTSVLRHLREQAQRVRSIAMEQADPAAELNAEAERDQAEAAAQKLEQAKRRLEAAKRKREEGTRKLEAAKRKREQAEREMA